MAHPKPWLKMWIEWIHDPKMLGLTLAEQGAWWRLVTLAQQCGADGQLVKGNGTPLTILEIAKSLHITERNDMATFKRMIEKMEAMGSLTWNSDILTIVHFAERQARIPSSTKDAIRERVRQYRERQRVTKKPLPTKERESNKEKEIEGDKEAEEECNGVTPVTGNRKTVTTEAILAEISQLHEKNFGIITPLLAEKFKDFVDNYHGPLEWIKEAFAEAVTHNARKWVYVETILDRWQREGRKQHGRGVSSGWGAPAHKQNPHAAAKAAGWTVGGEDERDGARDQD